MGYFIQFQTLNNLNIKYAKQFVTFDLKFSGS